MRERSPVPCAQAPALSARRCTLPPRFCKFRQRWGRVCPRPSPSLGHSWSAVIKTAGAGRGQPGQQATGHATALRSRADRITAAAPTGAITPAQRPPGLSQGEKKGVAVPSSGS